MLGRVTASQIAPRIGSVGHSTRDVRLDIGGRHQPHLVAKLFQLKRPETRAGAGLYAYQARWHLAEELENLASAQLAAQRDSSVS